MLSKLYDLLIPRRCLQCKAILSEGERFFCTDCYIKQPYVLPNWAELQIKQLLEGHFLVQNATALWHYRAKDKQADMAKIAIRAIKYLGNKDLSFEIGKFLASSVIHVSNQADPIDVVVPVPLHLKKQRKRGYNQAYVMAQGLSSVLKIPCLEQVLLRLQHKQTQTNKDRWTRWQSMKSVFKVVNPDLLSGKHVLLIDDVITTGATITSCANCILNIPETRVSVASAAFS